MRTSDPYYLWQNDAQTGPFTLSQLRSMWGYGTITTDTLYWQEGDPAWLAVSTILRELEPATLAPPVPQHSIVPLPSPMPVVHASVQLAATRTCVFCAEPIAEAAMKCRHCGEILDPRLRAADEASKAAALRAVMPQQPPVTVQQSVVLQNFGSKHPFPHWVHLIITIFCLGIWLPIWILHYLFRNRHYYY